MAAFLSFSGKELLPSAQTLGDTRCPRSGIHVPHRYVSGFVVYFRIRPRRHAEFSRKTPDAGWVQQPLGSFCSTPAGAMTLFHLLAAEFESACPGVDVQAFPRRRALEVAAEDGEAA